MKSYFPEEGFTKRFASKRKAQLSGNEAADPGLSDEEAGETIGDHNQGQGYWDNARSRLQVLVDEFGLDLLEQALRDIRSDEPDKGAGNDFEDDDHPMDEGEAPGHGEAFHGDY